MALTRYHWRRSTKVLLFALPGALLAWWLLRPSPTDRQLVEDLVARAESGVEAGSVSEVMSCVARDYHDSRELERSDIAGLLHRVMRNTTRIDVEVTRSDIDVTSRRATGTFDVQVYLYEGDGSVIPLHRRLEVQFEKRPGGWRNLFRPAWVVTSVSGHGLFKDMDGLL